MRCAFLSRYGVCWLETSTKRLSAFMVCLNSSENFTCSWSCQVSPSAENRACNDTILSLRSVLNRFSSSAKRRTCSGSIIAWAIVFLSVCVCGSPGRRVLPDGASDLPKLALFPPARQILTTSAARQERSLTLPPVGDPISLASFGGEGRGEEAVTPHACRCLPMHLCPSPQPSARASLAGRGRNPGGSVKMPPPARACINLAVTTRAWQGGKSPARR